jgi:hypothetical protein
MTLVSPEPRIQRDRYGRPLVVPPGGGKAVPYTRCTTFIDVIEDKFNLNVWSQRMVALGLASRPDLMLSIAAHKDDKKELNRIIESAKEAAAASAAATTGTALHALTELVDRGETIPVIPPEYQADLASYEAATASLKATHIEEFCVLDTLKIGGTPDRIVEFNGARYIADIKTGSIEWGTLKIAMQLAVYARSKTYDVATTERGIHGAETTRGLIIHLPAGKAECQLHWVDLEAGWYAVNVAKQVREQRNLSFGQLTTRFDPDEKPRSSLHAEKAEQERLLGQIQKAGDPDSIRALWGASTHVWTDDLTEAARQRIATLNQ